MKKFLKFFTAFAVFLFIFTACKGSGGSEEFTTMGFAKAPDSTCEIDNIRDDEDEYEEEIIYPDVYKIDGDVLWLAIQGKGLVAVDISDPEKIKTLKTFVFPEIVKEIHFYKGYAFVVVIHPDEGYDSGETYAYRSYSKIMAIDTRDPECMMISDEIEIEGEIAGSTQVGDVIYVASLEKAYSWKNCGGEEGRDGTDRVSVMSIDIKDPETMLEVSRETVEDSYYTTVYVSQKAAYVAEANFYYWNESHGEYPIIRFDLSDPEGKTIKKTAFTTKGYMNAAWMMNEKDGILYTITSSKNSGGKCVTESFDVSDPENIKRLDYQGFYWSNGGSQLEEAIFDGDRIYAVPRFSNRLPLVVDISDPDHLRYLGELSVPEETYQLLAIKENKLLLACSRYNEAAKICLYDAEDPENVKKINVITIKRDADYAYVTKKFHKNAFKIYDELGLIILPDIDYFRSRRLHYKLHLIDLDLKKGLKLRGFIGSRKEIMYGVAVSDSIFSVGENELLMYDASDRDDLKIKSELTLADSVHSVSRCGKSICAVKDLKVGAYDVKNLGKIWESSKFSDEKNTNSDIVTAINGSRAYIFKHTDFLQYWDEFTSVYYNGDSEERETFTPYVKIVKLDEKESFEETGEFKFNADTSYKSYPILSENNVIAMFAVKYGEFDKEGNRTKDPKIKFFDMNDPEKGINASVFDFKYVNLSCGHSIFAVGDTLWTSGCKLKKKRGSEEEYGEEYYCYAIPFDASDPAKPKVGKRINIPGELVGVSDDGEYLYTKTPAGYYEGECVSKNGGHCWNYIYPFDFYILKLNEDKSGFEVVKKETLEDSNSYSSGKHQVVSNKFFVKNDRVFLIKASTGEGMSTCLYRNDARFDMKLISSVSGEELAAKTFENILDSGSVKGGGIILRTTDTLIYIDENGNSKDKTAPTDPDSMILSETLVLDGRIYIPAGSHGFHSFSVK